jgi:hypothetical protein
MVGFGGLAGAATSLLEQTNWAAWTPALVAGSAAVGLFGVVGPKALPLFGRAALLLFSGASLVFAPGGSGPLLFALLFGLAISWGERGARLAMTIAAATAAAALAFFVHRQVANATELQFLPLVARFALAGAAFSAVSLFAVAVRHVQFSRDQVATEYGRLRDRTAGEVQELVVRAHGVWTRAGACLSEEDDNRRLLEEAVMRLFQTAGRWSEIERDGSQMPAAALADRMESLDRRIQAAEDAVVRKQYQQARAALAEQVRYLKDIGVSRERVLARMHNYLAAMERLHLALVNVESASASREALVGILSDLRELGEDIDIGAAAVGEVERVSSGAKG